ncbi:MAG TPA: serine/threonine-protein kinase [Gemmataceae bacterium]|nr:serine/threonine-protein kinase [Gemmataceae bacterium]
MLLSCGRCRQWEREVDGPPDVPFICPVCGGPVPDIAPAVGGSEAPTQARPLASASVLDTTDGPLTAAVADAPPFPPCDWPTIAGHEILGELGRGGMGVVYMARQVGLNRIVALKMILSGQHAGETERARFKAEAEVAARLVHPNIVQIHEVGEANGCPFFSLEYVEGGSLAAKLDGTPWAPRPAAELIETLARALQAAHKHGVIHRDLKPANVLLTMEGQPKITDFGLAKKLDDAAGQTQSGAILGTPSYMAPEQAGNRAVKVGPAADVYALGAMLYELLTGRPPFKAATTLDTVLQVINDEPVPPRQLQPKTPRDLDTICLKCLRKEPKKRYGSAEELAEDLARYLDGKPITARRVGRLERGWRWCRRNPVAAWLTAMVFSSLAAGAGIASWFAVQAHEEAQQVRDEKHKVLDEELRVRRHLYDAQMSRVQLAWEENERDAIPPLLDEQTPARTDGVDLRGFEWYFWLHRKPTPLFAVRSLAAFHTDGRRVAWPTVFNGKETQFTVWDAETGQDIYTFSTPIIPGGECLAFSPDGRFMALGGAIWPNNPVQLAARGQEITLRVYDAATGTELRVLPCPAAISSVEFSADGGRVAAATTDGKARVWDAALGTPLFAFPWPDKAALGSTAGTIGLLAAPAGQGALLAACALFPKPLVNTFGVNPSGGALAFDPKGRLLWSRDGSVVGWDLTTGTQAFAYAGNFPSLVLSPDGERLARPNIPGVMLYDAESGREIGAFMGAGSVASCVAWSADGRRLATGHDDGAVTVWDAATGREIETIRGQKGPIVRVALSADGKRILSGGADGIRVWEINADPDAHAVFKGLPPFALSADGAHLAGWANGGVTIWDMPGRQVKRIIPWREALGGLAFSPDSARLLGWSQNGPVHVWSVADGAEVCSLQDEGLKRTVVKYRTVEYSPDGRAVVYAITSNGRNYVGAWDLETRLAKPKIDITEGDFRITTPVFSPDQRRIAVPFESTHTLTICDAANGNRLFTMDAVSTFAAYSPDGRLIAGDEQPEEKAAPDPLASLFGLAPTSAKPKPTLVVWDAETGKRIAVLPQYVSPARAAIFSPDGRRLAAMSADGVRVWNLDTKNEVLSLKGIGPVQFSPDGRFLAGAAADGTIRVWNIERTE